MEFIETPVFTRLILEIITEDEYRELQNLLVENPERGDIIRGGGVSESYATLSQGLERVVESGWSTTGLPKRTKSSCC